MDENLLIESMNNKDLLLVDCCGYASLVLNEGTGGATRFQGKVQEANRPNKNNRIYTKEVLDLNVANLVETMESRGLFGELDHCLISPDFRVLTPQGWKEFKEIRVGDTVYSRKNGQMVESKVNAIVDQPYEGVVHHYKGKSIDCTFTPNHKFLTVDRYGKEEYIKSKDIVENPPIYSHNYIPKRSEWQGSEQKTFMLPAAVLNPNVRLPKDRRAEYRKPLVLNARDFCGLLGIYLAEGFLSQKGYGVEISQKTEYGKKLVKEVLEKTNLNWKEHKNGFRISDARLYNYLAPLGNKYTKYIPKEIKNLSADCLENLLFWFTIGDGRIQKLNDDLTVSLNHKIDLIESDNRLMDCGKYTRLSMFTVSKDLITDLSECLVKAGYSSVLTKVIQKDRELDGRIIKASNCKPLYMLNVNRSKGIYLNLKFLKIIQEYHAGRIYCLTTEIGNFYMEYKGKCFWTGNSSDSIVHLANASHLITKLWWEGNNLMCEGEILNTPSGKVLKNLAESGVRWGMSSRGVGSGKTNAEGVLVIGENFKLITFDAVADPSTYSAYPKKIQKENFSEHEVTSIIDSKSVNPKALISYFGQALQERLKKQ